MIQSVSVYGLLSFVHQLNNAMGLDKSRRESLEKAIQYAKKAQRVLCLGKVKLDMPHKVSILYELKILLLHYFQLADLYRALLELDLIQHFILSRLS